MLALWVSIPTLAVGADDADGSSCANAIPVHGGMQLPIVRAGDVWFTAHTFDLPLTLVFTPSNQSTTQQPQAFFDFSCTSGEYDDPILNKYFNIHSSSYIPMPYQYPMERQVDDQGKLHFVLTVPVQFRDLLAKVGLTYNIQAYVRVYFPESGQSEISLDDQYSTCMSGGQIMKLGDKMDIAPNDSDSYAILPFGTFRMDSIHYVWTGTAPATIYLMKDCSDLPQSMNEAMETWTMQPGEKKRLSMMEVRQKGDYYEKCGTEGDLVYMHVISTSAGEIQVNRTEMAPPENNAVLLKFGVPVKADSSILYFFPKDWNDGMRFVSSSRYIMRAYLSTTGYFEISDPDAGDIGKFQFGVIDEGHELGFSTREMDQITQMLSNGQNYVYVRFRTNDPNATVTLWEWTQNECAGVSTTAIMANASMYMPGARGVSYRLRYSEISGYPLSIIFSLTKYACTFYIAKDCGKGYTATSSKVVYFKSVSRNSTLTIPAATIDSWANDVDQDGYLYLVATPPSTSRGSITLSTTKPPEEDPEPEPEPECEKTITVSVNPLTPYGSVSFL